MQITAAVVREPSGPFSLEPVELADLQADEVLVRIAGVGICHTDLLARDQAYPMPLPGVLGHEGSGVVEAVGDGVGKVAPGDHVVLTFRSCGSCRNCLQARPGYCSNIFELTYGGVRADGSSTMAQNGSALHGSFFSQSSFATYAIAHQSNAVKVRRDVPIELLGPLGCGIQTGVGGVINALAARPGTSIAVFGTGAVGLSAVVGARIAGCSTIVGVDVNPRRLELAHELGATHVVDARGESFGEELRAAAPDGLDYAIDTTGRPATIRSAVDALAPLGVCGVIGGSPLGTELVLDQNHVLFGGRTVRGIIGGDAIPDLFIPQLVELHLQGRLPLERMVRFYALDEINEAVADTESGRTVKAILRPA